MDAAKEGGLFNLPTVYCTCQHSNVESKIIGNNLFGLKTPIFAKIPEVKAVKEIH